MKKFNLILIITLILIFNATILSYPKDIITAATDGLLMWFNAILPSMLPFVIGTNILIALGFVKFLGKILEPVARLLFGVNGAGAFSIIAGFCGYPMGVKTTIDLYEKGELSKIEAQKLLGFVNNAGAIFIIGTVGVTMFHSRSIGYFMLIVHYSSAIITGIFINVFSKKSIRMHKKATLNELSETKGISQIFSESVISAMQSMINIGGFIILFSVICEIIDLSILPEFVTTLLGDNTNPIIYGSIEIMNGLRHIQNTDKSGIILAISLLSFGGLSVHAQSISFISKTDLSISKYLFHKIIHAGVSLPLGFIMYYVYF